MQQKPLHWDELLAKPHVMQFYCEIAGEDYTSADIASATITKSAFDTTLSIGNATSATLDIKIMPKSEIPRAAKIKCFVRINTNEQLVLLAGVHTDNVMYSINTDDDYALAESYPETTAWLNFGTFYIDERVTDSLGWMTITAYDAILACEQIDDGNGWIGRLSPNQTVNRIVSKLQQFDSEITADSRNRFITMYLDDPAGRYTLRNMLQYIAAASGGNFIMTEDNKLRLVPIQSYTSTPEIQSQSVDTIGEPITISKVILYPDNNTKVEAGDDTGYAISADCPYATEDVVEQTKDALYGTTYTGFSAESVMIDPAIEIGDSVNINGVHSIANQLTFYINSLMSCDAGAPLDYEVNHEFPYTPSEVQEFNREIAKTKSEILTTTNSISLRVTGVENEVSQITTDLYGIDLSVTNGENSSFIKLTSDNIETQAKEITFSGMVKFTDLDGSMGETIINGSVIDTGTINADKINLDSEMIVHNSNQGIGYGTGKYGDTAVRLFNDVYASAYLPGTEVICTPSAARISAANTEITVNSSGGIRFTVSDNYGQYNYDLVPGQFSPLSLSDLGASTNRWRSIYLINQPNVSSDKRKKHEIEDNVSKYDYLFDNLHAVLYDWKDNPDGKERAGFYAQDVENTLIECGLDPEKCDMLHKDPDGDDFSYSLNYNWLIPLLVDRVQRLEKRIKELEK